MDTETLQPEIELYMFRHAESAMNVQPDIIGGRSNEAPLTNRGVRQAKHLGRELLRLGYEFDEIHCSPAVRTRMTAHYALEEMGLSVEPLIHDDLQELSQGDWEKLVRQDVYVDDVLGQVKLLGKDFKAPNGESVNEVGQRIASWVTAHCVEGHPERPYRIAVFAHGFAIRSYASHLHDWTHEKTRYSETPNTSSSKFVRTDGEWSLEYLGRLPRELEPFDQIA